MGHELGQRPRSFEHERVDRDPGLRAALNLAQGLLDRPPRGRIVELHLAVLEVGGRLAVGDDHDLAVGGPAAGQDPAGQEEPVLEVRAVLVAVPGELGQRPRPDLAGVVGKADHGQVVARVLGPDQRVERDGHLLGCEEAAAQEHRSAHVDQQDRGSARRLLRPMDREIGGVELDRPAPLGRRRILRSGQGIGQRLAQVEVERVAELERLGPVAPLRATPGPVDAVLAEGIPAQSGEEVVEDLLADPPAAARSQLEVLA